MIELSTCSKNIGQLIVHKIVQILDKVCTILATFLLLSLMLLSFTQIILRNFFSIGSDFVETFVRHEVLWITFSGAVLTTIHGKHISIDILPRYLYGRKRLTLEKILLRIIYLSASLISILLFSLSISFIGMEIERGALIDGFLPAWTLESIIPIGFFLLSISSILKVLVGEIAEK